MQVNFTDRQIDLTGVSRTGRIIGTATISSMEDGKFAGSNLMWNYGTNMNGTATINGSFHGAGGNAVSGIYSDNNRADPKIYGAIAGTQQ